MKYNHLLRFHKATTYLDLTTLQAKSSSSPPRLVTGSACCWPCVCHAELNTDCPSMTANLSPNSAATRREGGARLWLQNTNDMIRGGGFLELK